MRVKPSLALLLLSSLRLRTVMTPRSRRYDLELGEIILILGLNALLKCIGCSRRRNAKQE